MGISCTISVIMDWHPIGKILTCSRQLQVRVGSKMRPLVYNRISIPYMVVVIDIEPIRERFSAVAPFLDERGRRLVAAAEAFAAGYGGIAAVAMATGVAPSTIGRGLKELAQDEPSERVRRPGAGRKRTVSKDPTLIRDLEALVEPTTRGDP